MTVAELALRCLDYPNITVADAPTVAPGAVRWIKDAIFGALGEMQKEAPGLFRSQVGALLKAPQTLNVTVDSGTLPAVTLSSSGIVPGDLCTLRLTGNSCDVNVKNVSGTAAEIAPSFDGTTGTVAATVWHDALELSAYADIGDVVLVSGKPIEQVSSREHAKAQRGSYVADGSNDAGTPEYFWTTRHKTKLYVCFYPMPSALVAVSVELLYRPADIAEADIYTSTADFNLDASVSREVLLPLVVERWMASPLMASRAAVTQVQVNAKLAREKLQGLSPGSTRLPDWGENVAPRPHAQRW